MINYIDTLTLPKSFKTVKKSVIKGSSILNYLKNNIDIISSALSYHFLYNSIQIKDTDILDIKNRYKIIVELEKEKNFLISNFVYKFLVSDNKINILCFFNTKNKKIEENYMSSFGIYSYEVLSKIFVRTNSRTIIFDENNSSYGILFETIHDPIITTSIQDIIDKIGLIDYKTFTKLFVGTNLFDDSKQLIELEPEL